MRFLLDTNIVSDLVRHPRGKISNRISEVGEKDVCTSIVAAAELRYGSTRKNSSRLTAPHRSRGDRDHRGDLVQGLADLPLRNLNVEIIL
jgi:predicted nucleic acid-binding protein